MSRTKFNIPWFTLGGRQFWRDRFVHGGWRIQENAFTGHSRLLDPLDIRRAWGRYEACRKAFEELRQCKKIQNRSLHVVILLHGLGRSRGCMSRLSRAIRKEGYEAVPVEYPSTRRKIGDHARGLEEILNGLIDADTVSFVTHSLGALVVREALSREGDWKSRLTMGRLVMIAPPSRGVRLAEIFKLFIPFRWITGPAGQELTPERVQEIDPPSCPFGIIAGARGNRKGYNPLIPGDDDGIVGLEETRLEGSADFLVVKELHPFITNSQEVIRAVLSFLKTGKFRDHGDDRS